MQPRKVMFIYYFFGYTFEELFFFIFFNKSIFLHGSLQFSEIQQLQKIGSLELVFLKTNHLPKFTGIEIDSENVPMHPRYRDVERIHENLDGKK